MNRQFVIKMMQAKQLQYEAFKEIMPEPMAKRIDHLESDLIDIGKEYFMSAVFNNENGFQESDTECDSKDDSKRNSKDSSKDDSKGTSKNGSKNGSKDDLMGTSKYGSKNHSITKTKMRKVTIE